MASAISEPMGPLLSVLTSALRAVARRLRPHPMIVQLLLYALVGVAGTTLNVVLFLVARNWMSAVPANLIAVVLSTLVSTEANRRLTFHDAHSRHWRTALQNLGTIVFYATYGAAVLLLLDTVIDEPSTLLESITVAVASIFGGVARFAVLRLWAFAPPARRRAVDRSTAESAGDRRS